MIDRDNIIIFLYIFASIENYMTFLKSFPGWTFQVMKSGHPVLFSSCWYINYIKYGTDWPNFYRCDPTSEAGDNRLFLGGEACMWGEFVDETNLLPNTWPRTCAVAEVLWSHTLNETDAKYRIEEHVCRMRRRGIPAQPANGPSYCHY